MKAKNFRFFVASLLRMTGIGGLCMTGAYFVRYSTISVPPGLGG
jgi:hypothetical protein